jgi:hypothetical protein
LTAAARYYFVTCFGCCAIAAFTILYLYFTGYCFSEERYIPQSELIERAMLYRAPYIKGLDRGSAVTHTEIRAYLRDNPKCCRVENGFYIDNFVMDFLLGCSPTWVEIRHPLSDAQVAISPASGRYALALLEISRCGKLGRVIDSGLTESEVKVLFETKE